MARKQSDDIESALAILGGNDFEPKKAFKLAKRLQAATSNASATNSRRDLLEGIMMAVSVSTADPNTTFQHLDPLPHEVGEGARAERGREGAARELTRDDEAGRRVPERSEGGKRRPGFSSPPRSGGDVTDRRSGAEGAAWEPAPRG